MCFVQMATILVVHGFSRHAYRTHYISLRRQRGGQSFWQTELASLERRFVAQNRSSGKGYIRTLVVSAAYPSELTRNFSGRGHERNTIDPIIMVSKTTKMSEFAIWVAATWNGILGWAVARNCYSGSWGTIDLVAVIGRSWVTLHS